MHDSFASERRQEVRNTISGGLLKITVDSKCQWCAGTGLQIRSEERGSRDFIEVRIKVCLCVKIVHKKKLSGTDDAK